MIFSEKDLFVGDSLSYHTIISKKVLRLQQLNFLTNFSEEKDKKQLNTSGFRGSEHLAGDRVPRKLSLNANLFA